MGMPLWPFYRGSGIDEQSECVDGRLEKVTCPQRNGNRRLARHGPLRRGSLPAAAGDGRHAR
jgi:hypothetical protein